MNYYLNATYRRKILDALLDANKEYLFGNVLDIGGGRHRGKFKRPKINSWISADIEENLHPDVVCDVQDMHLEKESFDSIKATELFEHVENPELGLKECCRVLKKGGYMVISAPFFFPIHSAPHDYQRWTEYKWRVELKKAGFEIEQLVVMGRYFTVLSDTVKVFVRSLPRFIKYFCYISYPALDLLTRLDSLRAVKEHKYLGECTTGYFMVVKKI